MKIAIIGTGISGLSIANMINNEHEVILFEKEIKPGGLIRCERVKDCLFHQVGGHVFNSKNQKVLDWFWSYFDRENEFVKAKRKARVLFNNQIIGYPIENYIYLLEESLVKKIIHELLDLHKKPKLDSNHYEHFESFLQNNFGTTLYEVYFKPYNNKLWRTDLSTVAMEWLEGKLPMPNLQQIIQNNILHKEEDLMVHASFYYPKEGGSQFIVNKLKDGLNIQMGRAISQIEIRGEELILENGHSVNKIIYCGDVRNLPPLCKQLLNEGGVDVSYLEGLRSISTSNLFCETDENDISWLYIPQSYTKAHRIIYTGNFSSSNNRGSNRNTCVVEFSGKIEYEVMKEEIKQLPGNLTPLAYNYEPNSYVIQDKRTRKEIEAAKQVLERFGIYLLGRFAEWEYYNMDKAIEAAFILKDKLYLT